MKRSFNRKEKEVQRKEFRSNGTKIRSDSLADIEKPTNRWSEIPPAIFGG